jgi:hypothetical protein
MQLEPEHVKLEGTKNMMAAIVSLILIITVSSLSSAYAFKAYNVNLNRTVDLPVQLTHPKTTIQPGYPSCGTDTFTTIDNVNKEKTQNPTMFKSDAIAVITLPANSSYSWCGLKH